MKILLVMVFIGFATASQLHFAPLILTATTQHQQQQQLQDQQPATLQYHNQNSQGYYSYGYSGDSSAKAEYKSVDGTSKGFYAYVDTNGKLQKVEYEAGGQQGFKAAATNLPKAPVDNQRAPLPVQDTPEVQMAKKAHFEAYREAELRAALASNDDAERDDDEQQAAEQEALMMAENNARLFGNGVGADGQGNGLQDLNLNGDSSAQHNDGSVGLMTTYALRHPDSLSNLNSYSLTQVKSGGVLHLNGLTTGDRTLTYLQPSYAALRPATVENVRVPVHSYYSVLTPDTNYHVASPTVITTLPRLQTHGQRLPIALSTTFLSQRIDTKH